MSEAISLANGRRVTVEEALLALGFYYALFIELRNALKRSPVLRPELIEKIKEANNFLKPITDKIYGPDASGPLSPKSPVTRITELEEGLKSIRDTIIKTCGFLPMTEADFTELGEAAGQATKLLENGVTKWKQPKPKRQVP